MTAIIPVVVASYVYRKEGHDISLYDIGLWTFVVGTVFFHFLCYIRKDSASPQLPRLIDYIYVCSAVIGLSGTAREIDRTVRVNTYSESVRLSKLNLNWMKDQVDKAAKSACAESTSGAQCSDLTSVRIFIEEGLPKALAIKSSDQFHALESFDAFTRNVDKHIATLKALPEAERDHIIHYDETVQRLAAITSAPPDENAGWKWKLLGVFFLPSALALRITKISVEIFSWFPKS